MKFKVDVCKNIASKICEQSGFREAKERSGGCYPRALECPRGSVEFQVFIIIYQISIRKMNDETTSLIMIELGLVRTDANIIESISIKHENGNIKEVS